MERGWGSDGDGDRGGGGGRSVLGDVLFSDMRVAFLLLAPVFVAFCYVFGVVVVWTAALLPIILYTVYEHRQDRLRFRRRYQQYFLHEQQRRARDHSAVPSTALLNLLIRKWWRCMAASLARDSLLPALESALQSSKPSIVEDFIVGGFSLGDNPPAITSISVARERETAVHVFTADCRMHFVPDLNVMIYAFISTYKVPVEIRDLKFIGDLRVRMTFPRSSTDMSSASVSVLNASDIDFAIKVGVGLDIAGVPGLGNTIRKMMTEQLESTFLWPKQFYLFGAATAHDLSIAARGETLDPITDICIVHTEEMITVPDGYELVDRSVSREYAANVNSNTKGRSTYLCIRRGDGAPVTNLQIAHAHRTDGRSPQDVEDEDKELCAAFGDGYRILRQSTAGYDANLSGSSFMTQKAMYLALEVGVGVAPVVRVGVMFPGMGEQLPKGYIQLKDNLNEDSNGRDCYICFQTVQSAMEAQAHDAKSRQASGPASGQASGAGEADAAAPSLASKIVRGTKRRFTRSQEGERERKKTTLSVKLDPKARRRLAEAEYLGIDQKLVEYVSNLCKESGIFINFPMEHAPRPFVMTKKQLRHAQRILEEVEDLSALRREICPGIISEDKFWYTYFSLMQNRLGSRLETQTPERHGVDAGTSDPIATSPSGTGALSPRDPFEYGDSSSEQEDDDDGWIAF